MTDGKRMGAPNRLAVYKATAQSIRAQLSELRLYGEPSTGGQGIIEGETMYALKTHASAQARQVTTALSDDSLDTAWSGIEIYLAFQQPVLLTQPCVELSSSDIGSSAPVIESALSDGHARTASPTKLTTVV